MQFNITSIFIYICLFLTFNNKIKLNVCQTISLFVTFVAAHTCTQIYWVWGQISWIVFYIYCDFFLKYLLLKWSSICLFGSLVSSDRADNLCICIPMAVAGINAGEIFHSLLTLFTAILFTASNCRVLSTPTWFIEYKTEGTFPHTQYTKLNIKQVYTVHVHPAILHNLLIFALHFTFP